MFRGIERPFVPSPSNHGDELWEVPEGGENPTGWNEWRVSPVTVGHGPRSALGRTLDGVVAWQVWAQVRRWTPDFSNAIDNGRHSRMNEDLHLCLHGPQLRMM